jgi:2-succinyl-6-hydroxy-2,4-cyclohexadiene-1-carboxylate synthase
MKLEIQNTGINLKLFPAEIDKTKPVLLFIHGFASSLEEWVEVINLLDKYQSVAVDLPGFGDSEIPVKSEYYSQDFLSWLIKEIIIQLELKNVLLVGYSMGGRAALSFAVKHFSMIKGLILESSSAGIKDVQERNARIKSDEELIKFIESNSIKKFVDYWTNLEIFNTQKKLSQEKLDIIKKIKLKQNKVGLINSLKEFGTGKILPLWDKLNKVNLPILLITGELDKKFCKINSEMVTQFPNAKHILVENAGHNIHLEKPLEFVNLLDKFLNQL